MKIMSDGWVDFNDIDSGDMVTVLTAHCGTFPTVGDSFTVGDYDGNRCPGTVVSFHGAYARIKLHMNLFQSEVLYQGRVLSVDERTFTVEIFEEGVPLHADISLDKLPKVEAGDIVDIGPLSVSLANLGTWTAEDIAEIHRRAAKRQSEIVKLFEESDTNDEGK